MERQQVLPDRPASAHLTSLSLRNFRNYEECRVRIDAANVLLLGENGAGKTNLMEAVSLLAPGRGLRRARAEHLPRQDSDSDHWAVSADLWSGGELVRIGTGVLAGGDGVRRVMRRDGQTVAQTEIGRLVSVSWLTPRMDGIFIDSPGARRRFLDRLVIAFDAAHIGRTNRYEKLLRERAALLAEGRSDEAWFGAIESSLAEAAIAVTAARQALMADLNAEAADGWFDFPGVRLALDGLVEDWLAAGSALQAEDRYVSLARQRRQAGDQTLVGPHVSDMSAVNSHTGAPAHLASTGQQKALLVAVVLAHARLQARRLGRPPLLLLDDVVAHLDVARRGALFEAVGAVGAQAWFSGTDQNDFAGLDAQPLPILAHDGMASINSVGGMSDDRQ